MKIIAIANQKGGAGKTTTAINLSAAISSFGKKVLLIDLDPQGNATSGIGIDKSELANTSYSCLLKNIPVIDSIQNTQFEGLDIIPANTDLANAEAELLHKISRESILRMSLSKADLNYDYVIIDCPPSLGSLTVNALVAANSVLIPLEAAEFGMEGTEQFLTTFELVRYINQNLDIEGVLLTRADVNTNAFKKYKEQLKGIFGEKVYDVYISRNQKISDAQSFENFPDKKAKPAVFAYPDCKGSRQYIELAKEVLKNE